MRSQGLSEIHAFVGAIDTDVRVELKEDAGLQKITPTVEAVAASLMQGAVAQFLAKMNEVLSLGPRARRRTRRTARRQQRASRVLPWPHCRQRACQRILSWPWANRILPWPFQGQRQRRASKMRTCPRKRMAIRILSCQHLPLTWWVWF